MLGIGLLAIANYSYLIQKSQTTKIEITDVEIAKQSWVYGCADKTVRAARVAPDVIGDETVATEIAQKYCSCYFQEVLDQGIGIEEIANDINNPQTKSGKALIKAKDVCYEKYNEKNTQ